MPTSGKKRSDDARTYRAGIVGCGRIGCGFDDEPRVTSVRTHAGGYKKSDRFELAALADLDADLLDRYATRLEVAGRYVDYVRMLERERLDVLSVCTPNPTHREIVERAAESGVRAIFCEKPIADSLDAADAMVRTCREHGVLLMIDHQRRFDRMHRDAVEYVRSGKLGTIQQVTCYYTAGVANTGSHVFDLLRFFFGDVASVRAWPSSNPSPNPADPNYDGWLQFRDGPSTALQACDVKHYVILEINILGEAGRLRIMASGYDAQYEVVRESDKFAGYRELFPAATPFETPTEHEFMLQAMDHLSGCLDRGEPPISTGTDGRASLEIICALHASAAEESRLVTLPLENSRSMIQSR